VKSKTLLACKIFFVYSSGLSQKVSTLNSRCKKLVSNRVLCNLIYLICTILSCKQNAEEISEQKGSLNKCHKSTSAVLNRKGHLDKLDLVDLRGVGEEF
jgi:hypothetical protein